MLVWRAELTCRDCAMRRPRSPGRARPAGHPVREEPDRKLAHTSRTATAGAPPLVGGARRTSAGARAVSRRGRYAASERPTPGRRSRRGAWRRRLGVACRARSAWPAPATRRRPGTRPPAAASNMHRSAVSLFRRSSLLRPPQDFVHVATASGANRDRAANVMKRWVHPDRFRMTGPLIFSSR